MKITFHDKAEKLHKGDIINLVKMVSGSTLPVNDKIDHFHFCSVERVSPKKDPSIYHTMTKFIVHCMGFTNTEDGHKISRYNIVVYRAKNFSCHNIEFKKI